MKVSAFALVMLIAASGLGACMPVPDVVTLEAVPTPRFARALAQCQAEASNDFSLGDPVKRCLKAKGYRFLKQY
jgi:hypothetical protein